MADRKRYSDSELKKVVKSSYTMSGVLRKLGYAVEGASRYALLRRIAEVGIDISHFTQKGFGPAPRAWQEILVRSKKRINSRSAVRALRDMGRKIQCASCLNPGKWQGGSLTLQVHHINGDAGDNRPENLQILCPNCHAQTKSYCRKRSAR